jgi:pyruvate,orthophosphate dikinase
MGKNGKKNGTKASHSKAKGTPAPKQMVYSFGKRTDGDGTQKALLGGKGANLAAMALMGLPVPPGFTISTEVCNWYYDNGRRFPEKFAKQMKDGLRIIEKEVKKKFGDRRDPLLVSVRSGARDSMPGMMDTILNLGLNDITVEALKKATGNGRFAWDCYRRFVQMYGDVVMGVQKKSEMDHDPFEEIMDGLKRECGVMEDTLLTEENLKDLVKRYKDLVKRWTNKSFPDDPMTQLEGAVAAVFGSWNNDRATVYRNKYKIPHEWGTAVNVQAMVYGNMGDDCATGVAFTRDPANGENVFYGEYLINAQGEDPLQELCAVGEGSQDAGEALRRCAGL